MDPYGPMEWNRGVLIKKLNYCGSGVEARVALQQYYHPWGIPLVAYTVIPLWAAAHFYLSASVPLCLCWGSQIPPAEYMGKRNRIIWKIEKKIRRHPKKSVTV